MIIIEGSLLDSPLQFIGHQVNCRGAMGAGVARQIKQKYPDVYKCYKTTCEFNNPDDLLGIGEFIRATHEYPFKYVINIYGQLGYGTGSKQTDYDAFNKAWRQVIEDMQHEFQKEDGCQLVIGIPYKMGCGLAGGDWDIITEILEKIEKDLNVLFMAYCLGE